MHGVLFSTNRLLLSDWKMEHVFHLYFYNGQRGQTRTAHLTVGEHSDEPRGHRAAGVTYRRAWSCVCIVLRVSAYIHSPAEQCTCTDTDICIQRVCVSVPKSKVLPGALKPHRPWAVRAAPRSSEGTLRKGVPCSPGTAATSTSSTQPFGSPFTVAFKNKKPEKHHTKAKSAGKRGEGRFPVTVRSMAAAEAACTCAELRPPNMLQGSVSPPTRWAALPQQLSSFAFNLFKLFFFLVGGEGHSGLDVFRCFLTAFPFQTLTHTTGKRAALRTQAAQGRGLRL